MTPPNLFSFATSELTQDAFLAYLIAWADPKVSILDPAMHRAGTEFLRLLLDRHGLQLTTVTKLEVRVQVKNIDVLVYLEMEGANGIVLVIEDKVHAGSYNDLKKYLEAGAREFPDVNPEENVKGIYLRTGNQADYSAIKGEGFRVVDRRMLLDYLQAEETGNPPNAIFQNYRAYLEIYQRQLDAYKIQPVADWDGNAWVGFFSQQLVPDTKLLFNDYDYVPNRRGGFQGCWWTLGRRPLYKGYSVYLQIDGSNTKEEASYIKIKMETLPSGEAQKKGIKRIDLIRAFADAIEAHPRSKSLGLQRPKLRAGQWMTAAVVHPAPELRPELTDHSLQQLYDLQAFIFSICQ